jgi:hypothetical protein
MPTKIFKVSDPLSQAMKKAAHRLETSQQDVMVRSVIFFLGTLGSDEICQLIEQHDAIVADSANPESSA